MADARLSRRLGVANPSVPGAGVAGAPGAPGRRPGDPPRTEKQWLSWPGADPDLDQLAAAFLSEAEDDDQRIGPGGTDPTAWSLDDAVPPGGAAAVAFIEHMWAQPLVLAVRRAGGRVLDETWLTPDDLELLDRLAGETR
jgi:hypothetical protein